MRQRAAWAPQDREEDVVKKPNPLNYHARSYHVPCISLIMNIFILFHDNHLSVKFLFYKYFSKFQWLTFVLFKVETDSQGDIPYKFGFSQNCRGKYGRSLITETMDIRLFLTGPPQRKKSALVTEYFQSLSCWCCYRKLPSGPWNTAFLLALALLHTYNS